MALSKQLNEMVQVQLDPTVAGADVSVSPSVERLLDNVIGGITNDQTFGL